MSNVKKIQSIAIDGEFTLSRPVELADKTRFSHVRGPLIQTPMLPLTTDGDKITVLCSEEYADAIHGIDEMVVDTVSSKSDEWFGKHLTVTDVESLLKSSIKGHRCPKHVLIKKEDSMCFNHTLEKCEFPTTQFNGMMILQVKGLLIDEKRCEVQYVCHQVKLAEELPEDAGEDVKLADAAFVM